MRIKYWINKTKKSLREYGAIATAKKIVKKIIRKFIGGKPVYKRVIRDVLFVNGCDPNLVPHPYRYRVLHQMEQLNAGYLESEEVFYINLNPVIIRDFRVIIFYRCPWTEQVEKAIELAKSLNKKVLFDIDDLVIDTSYTDLIPYVKSLSKSDKAIYDDGVIRMGKTLRLCEGAITTTEALATELKKFVPSVYINRNVASEEMWQLSQAALEKRILKTKSEDIVIGYFSGSITHNADFDLVKPALIKLLAEFKNVRLLLLGELDLPSDLKNFANKIIKKPFTDWKNLPELISNVDINIAPIEESIFNDAKSENKWVEAALVKVPTVASNFGAFKQVIKHGETGLLCSTTDEWYSELKKLIVNEQLRNKIAENAFKIAKQKYNTILTGYKLARHINSVANRHIGFFLPSILISGGIRVALVHAAYLQDAGCDVDIIVPESNIDFLEFQDHKFNVIGLSDTIISAQYDTIVSTLYTTTFSLMNYSKAKRRLYLVQNYETDFYRYGEFLRGEAEKTYSIPYGLEYITISKWCEKWLKEKYSQKAKFAPNGINLSEFVPHKRNLRSGKIRILIEGDSASHYKNVDESFRIVDKLDKNKFEVWYMSYNAAPKDWYRVDRFLSKVSFEKVSQVYEQCDILIKSSWLESFSYPPLEMMATGGFCIVVPNDGNVEYLVDEKNCLFYELGNINAGLNCIEHLIADEHLQQKLYENGLETAKRRDWENCKEQILELYRD